MLRVADLFCGGGGTSTGAEQSGGAKVVFGLNHWKVAIKTHGANFPDAIHVNSRLENTHPSEATNINLLFASPECTFFSKARSGRPTSDQQRSGAWHVLPWIEHHRPSWVVIENVVEFRDWGPVDANGIPLPSKKGATFEAWIKAIKSLGYRVEFRVLNAADFGAATSRKRLFIICRKGNRNPVFPEPTHGRDTGGELPGLGLQPWRSAAEIIDWSIPCPSVFLRRRPLADKTLVRIEAGLRRFVAPFIAQWDNQNGGGSYVRSMGDPLATMTTKASMGLVLPYQVVFRNNMDSADLANPVSTITAGGGHHGLAVPFMADVNHGNDGHAQGRTHDVQTPLGTVTTHNGKALCLPFQFQLIGRGAGRSKSADSPVPTIIAARENHGVAIPWLSHYYGALQQSPVSDPVDTITTKDRHAFCVARCSGPEQWPEPRSDAMRALQETMRLLGVTDIGFRMLCNLELAAAQGFPADYQWHGTKAEITTQIGNSVPPPFSKAITLTILSV